MYVLYLYLYLYVFIIYLYLMSILKISTFIILLSLITFISSNTKDPDFVNKYKPDYKTEGDEVNFPKSGNKVKVHYIGTFTDGRKFDSSRDRGQEFEFHVGKGQVIKCWDEVILQMSKGERTIITCPSSTAYGSRGAGNVIPPNTDLNFDIELISFSN